MSEPLPETPKPAAPVAASAPAAKPAAPAAPAAAAKPAAAPVPPPPPVPVPPLLAGLSIPFIGVDFSLRGVNADATIEPQKVVDAAVEMDRKGFGLDTITGVDWMAQGQMEVVYDFFHPQQPVRASIRTRLARDNPELATISRVFPGANWHERETHDFLGIRFSGHPDMSPFLLPEDADYHPLKKDFSL